MKHRAVFVSLISFFLIGFLAHTVEGVDPKTHPYTDPSIAGAPAPSRCASLFEILDANEDHFIDKDEAKKSAETTAIWKSFDGDLDNRLSFEEFCAAMK